MAPDLGSNGLDWTDSELLSAYNTEMNGVISGFRGSHLSFAPDAYYLFVVPSFSEGRVEGFMPLTRRYGFIAVSQLNARTLAHELGHGAFSLRHTFSPKNVEYLPLGTTSNLMDYTSGTALYKYQWNLIHDSLSAIPWLEEEEEGAVIYGITWLGDYLWGLAPDEQESQIETVRALFKHVHENYDIYFNDSKTKDVNLNIQAYKGPTIRKASHQGIAKKIFK